MLRDPGLRAGPGFPFFRSRRELASSLRPACIPAIGKLPARASASGAVSGRKIGRRALENSEAEGAPPGRCWTCSRARGDVFYGLAPGPCNPPPFAI